MTGYPPLHFALLQGMLVGMAMLTPPLILAFGGRLKVTTADLLLMLPVYPVFALLTVAVFLPFEGDWADTAFGPLTMLRPLIVGGAIVLLGTVVTQWRGLSGRDPSEVAHRLGAALAIGAAWGVSWGFSGWLLNTIGMANNG